MDALYVLLLIVGFVVAVSVYVKFFGSIVVSRYEYLDLLSYSDWRSGRNLREEMQRRKGRRIRLTSFFIGMSELEKEGLVESCLQLRTVHTVKVKEPSYIITAEGIKAKGDHFDGTGRFRTVRRVGRIEQVKPLWW